MDTRIHYLKRYIFSDNFEKVKIKCYLISYKTDIQEKAGVSKQNNKCELINQALFYAIHEFTS